MLTKFELGCAAVSVAFFAAAADAWLNVGAVDLLVDLCLGDKDAPVPEVEMPMPDGGHGTHASLFAAAGLATLGLGLTTGELRRFFGDPTRPQPESRIRRRLIAAIIYVARSCDTAMPKDVAEAFQAVTGEVLPKGEVTNAIKYMRSRKAAPMERILGKVSDVEEQRRILAATCHVWSKHGLDSERATRAMERVAEAMGLEGNAINAALDNHWSTEATRVLSNVELFARRAISRATTQAQRITTRIRGIG